MAMLHGFAQYVDRDRVKLSVASVDHALRDGSAQEVAFVARHCHSLGVSHTGLKWTGWDGAGNVQAEARQARYTLLADWARAEGLQAVALAHTQDDLAETFLMRLARGSGLDGLAAMEARVDWFGVPFLRPFLTLRREDLRAYLRSHDFTWCEDPSNENSAFQRIKMREALGVLRPLGIDVADIAKAASQLVPAKRFIKTKAYQYLSDALDVVGGDFLLHAPSKGAPDPEILRRALNAVLQWQGVSVFPPRAEALEGMLAALDAGKSHTLNGCVVERDGQLIRIAREANAIRQLKTPTDALWDNRWALDGPHDPAFHIACLGEEGLTACPDWRAAGLPRHSLMSSPAVWNSTDLVAAPLAGLSNGWCARLTRSREQLLSNLFSH